MMQVFVRLFECLSASVFSACNSLANTLASTAANMHSLAKHLPLGLRVSPPKSPARFPTPLTQRLKNIQCEWGLESLGEGGISGAPEGGEGEKKREEERKSGERREEQKSEKREEKEEREEKEKKKKKKEKKPTRRAVMGWGGGEAGVGRVPGWARAGRFAAISRGGRR